MAATDEAFEAVVRAASVRDGELGSARDSAERAYTDARVELNRCVADELRHLLRGAESAEIVSRNDGFDFDLMLNRRPLALYFERLAGQSVERRLVAQARIEEILTNVADVWITDGSYTDRTLDLRS